EHLIFSVRVILYYCMGLGQ
ncbi:hypothetical protein EVA_01750, partial [gut metagenome]